MSQGGFKQPSQGQSAIRAPKPKSGKRTLKSPTGMLAIVFLVLMALVFYSSAQSPRRGEIPDEIIGTWYTTASDYADRSFEIRKTSLVFFVSDDEWTVNLIERVETEDLGGGTLFTLHYTDEGGDNEFSFYFDPKRQGVIRFQNQREMEWKRRS
ncbi:MAG: hypothetical protein P8X82_08340 [Gemmatimonadales bacterium]|jgi:hypothetical protein